MTHEEAKAMLAAHNPLNLRLVGMPHYIARTLSNLTVDDANFGLAVTDDGVSVAYGDIAMLSTNKPLAFEFLKLILIRTYSIFVADDDLNEALVLLKYWRFLSGYSLKDVNSDDYERAAVGDFLMDPTQYQGQVEWERLP